MTNENNIHWHGTHPVELEEAALLKQCQTKRLRRSGPGGQHRNKVETAIQLTHEPTNVIAEANEKRKQADNLKEAIIRLRVNLALQVRANQPLEGDTIKACLEKFPVHPLWKKRVRGRKIAVNPKHADFPILLANALDLLALQSWEIPVTAEMFQLSSSQLIKFFAIEQQGLATVNRHRIALGKNGLRSS